MGVIAAAILAMTLGVCLYRSFREKSIATALSDFARARAVFETQGLAIPAGFPVPVLSTSTIPILLIWLKDEPDEAPLWERLCERAPLPQ